MAFKVEGVSRLVVLEASTHNRYSQLLLGSPTPAGPAPATASTDMKVVIPAAGRGTRFLPLTKTMPKEMLPIVDRPIIQYVVEEALKSGAEDITIITGRGKTAIEDYFDYNPDLAEHAASAELESIERIGESSTLHFVRQRRPLGLADAIGLRRAPCGGRALRGPIG